MDIKFKYLNSPLLTNYLKLFAVLGNNQGKKVSIFQELTKAHVHMLANGLRNVKKESKKPKKRFK